MLLYRLYGALTTKTNTIQIILLQKVVLSTHAVMNGEAKADMTAAVADYELFILWKHSPNESLVVGFTGHNVFMILQGYE